jgi:hypothetical protein
LTCQLLHHVLDAFIPIAEDHRSDRERALTEERVEHEQEKKRQHGEAPHGNAHHGADGLRECVPSAEEQVTDFD